MDKNDLKNIVSRLILIDIDNKDFVFKYPFAGYILFYKDLKDLSFNQIQELNNYYKNIYNKKFGINLIRSIDQEGGVVFRFDFEDYPAICSQWVIDNEEDSFKLAYFNGLILRMACFNLNFSPVLDVNSNLDNPIIGVRSFSNDYSKVLKLSKAFIKGYKSVGIINCGKHFPGHGSVSIDSHLSLPETNLDFNELNVFLVNLDNLDSIMTAHIVYKDIDNFPATLSKKILDLIYQKNYQGIIFSDALNMLALKNFDFKDVLINSLVAGVDILLVLGKDEIKEEAIDIISDYAIKNESFFKIILNKYNKVNTFINSINEFWDQNFYNYYLDLKKWFDNEFNFNINIEGSLDKFKFYFYNDSVNFIFGNSYLNEIGIVEKIKNFINKKNIYYIDMNNFDINLTKNYLNFINDNVNLFYVPIYKDNNFVEFVNMIRNKGIKNINLITFANPFFNDLKIDFKIDLYGFSNIHLKILKKIIEKPLSKTSYLYKRIQRAEGKQFKSP
jgi:beta-N-acetylhexosaminidase